MLAVLTGRESFWPKSVRASSILQQSALDLAAALPRPNTFPAAAAASHVWLLLLPVLCCCCCPADMLEMSLLEAGMKAQMGGAAGMC